MKSDAKVYATTAEDRAARGAARRAGGNTVVVTGDSQREEDVNEEDSNQTRRQNEPMEVALRANTNLSGELGDDSNTGFSGAVSSRRQCGKGDTCESGARREV